MDATETLQPTDTPSQPDDSVGYSRVTHEKALQIIQLRKAKPDIEGNEIARLIGVHPSTVSRWLKLLNTDTVPQARQLAKSQALRAMMKLDDQVDHTDPRVSQGAAKAITALAGVQESGPAVQVGIQVIVGSVSHPAGPDPFDNASVNVSSQVLDSKG